LIKKVVLNADNNKTMINGELIGFVIPLGVNINSMVLETENFTIFNGKELTNGYYPLRVQARNVDGSWVTNSFEHFMLSDEVTLTVSVNADAPTNIVLLFDAKVMIEL